MSRGFQERGREDLLQAGYKRSIGVDFGVSRSEEISEDMLDNRKGERISNISIFWTNIFGIIILQARDMNKDIHPMSKT